MNTRWVWILAGVVVALLVVTGVWGYSQYRDKLAYQIYLQNQYQREFYEVIDGVENIQVNLGKSIVTGSPRQKALLFSDIRQQSFVAQEKINQLPISHLALNETSKFLAQVGDYCYSLFNKNLDGKPVSADDVENLEKLHNYAATLTVELQNLFDKIRDGKISMGELRREGYYTLKKEDNELDGEFEKIQKRMENYPRLIYDGPFSEHIQNIEPRGLTGENITFEEAKGVAKKFLYDREIDSIKMLSSGHGFIKTYGLEVDVMGKKTPIYIDISRKGGHVVWMLNGRPIKGKAISLEKAHEKAKGFIEKNGYRNMVSTYSTRINNAVIFNFVYSQDGVIIYPDMVKVKVALDNGEIVGFDARQYLTSHHDREIPAPRITENEARQNISLRFNPGKGRLAIIPLPGKREALCYEFKGEYQGDTFIVYINAKTGGEEDILQLIEDKTGEYTM